MIQRTLVFLENATEKRQSAILHSVDPKLARYTKGDFPNAGKCLFGQGFVKEVVSQVEADTAICKASPLANWASRELQTRKGPLPSKSTFFERAGPEGMGLGLAETFSTHTTESPSKKEEASDRTDFRVFSQGWAHTRGQQRNHQRDLKEKVFLSPKSI